jgi:hypothetical protein
MEGRKGERSRELEVYDLNERRLIDAEITRRTIDFMRRYARFGGDKIQAREAEIVKSGAETAICRNADTPLSCSSSRSSSRHEERAR